MRRDLTPRDTLLASISGVVRDRVTWVPIAGARIEAEGIVTLTMPDGSYELINLRTTVPAMSASQDGYETLVTPHPLVSGPNVRSITLKPLESRSSFPP